MDISQFWDLLTVNPWLSGILGILLGWLLTQLSGVGRSLVESRRIKKKAIFSLLGIWVYVRRPDAFESAGIAYNKLESLNLLDPNDSKEYVVGSIVQEISRTNKANELKEGLIIDRLTASIEDMSQVSPTIAVRMMHTLDFLPLETSIASDLKKGADIWGFGIDQTFEFAAFEILRRKHIRAVQDQVEDVIKRLARRVGPIYWIGIKTFLWLINKNDVNSEAANAYVENYKLGRGIAESMAS